jgi:topoisomerase IA-like protein
MLAALPAQPLIEEISLDEAKKLLQDGFTSAVGHADTANILADLIQIPVESARITVSLAR